VKTTTHFFVTKTKGAKVKKFLLAGILLALIASIGMGGNHVVQAQSAASVVINEYDQNPVGNDNKKSVEEWVELLNRTNFDIDIGGWVVESTHGANTGRIEIPQGTIIKAGGYDIVKRGAQWLDNTEMIILWDANGVEIDRTALTDDDKNDERSWQRCANGHDSNSSSDWRFRIHTPGASNDCK